MSRWLNGVRWTLGTALLGGALALGGFGLANVTINGAWAESEPGESGEHGDGHWQGNRTPRLVTPGYAEECSACHLAYPAELLPARSWRAIMGKLDNHFGENAELAPEAAKAITDYLVANAADVNPGRRSGQFLRNVSANVTPLRITETPFFKRRHREVPAHMVKDNPQVGSFSQCQACHGQDAQRGIFNEDTVDIPGSGRWD